MIKNQKIYQLKVTNPCNFNEFHSKFGLLRAVLGKKVTKLLKKLSYL